MMKYSFLVVSVILSLGASSDPGNVYKDVVDRAFDSVFHGTPLPQEIVKSWIGAEIPFPVNVAVNYGDFTQHYVFPKETPSLMQYYLPHLSRSFKENMVEVGSSFMEYLYHFKSSGNAPIHYHYPSDYLIKEGEQTYLDLTYIDVVAQESFQDALKRWGKITVVGCISWDRTSSCVFMKWYLKETVQSLYTMVPLKVYSQRGFIEVKKDALLDPITRLPIIGLMLLDIEKVSHGYRVPVPLTATKAYNFVGNACLISPQKIFTGKTEVDKARMQAIVAYKAALEAPQYRACRRRLYSLARSLWGLPEYKPHSLRVFLEECRTRYYAARAERSLLGRLKNKLQDRCDRMLACWVGFKHALAALPSNQQQSR